MGYPTSGVYARLSYNNGVETWQLLSPDGVFGGDTPTTAGPNAYETMRTQVLPAYIARGVIRTQCIPMYKPDGGGTYIGEMCAPEAALRVTAVRAERRADGNYDVLVTLEGTGTRTVRTTVDGVVAGMDNLSAGTHRLEGFYLTPGSHTICADVV